MPGWITIIKISKENSNAFSEGQIEYTWILFSKFK